MHGLPDGVSACLFDLDGVLTQTATLHAAAWRAMFDTYLGVRAERDGVPFEPFDPIADYDHYVDGRPRADGVRAFLSSRGITLPDGTADDTPEAETVHGLGNWKNEIFAREITEHGVRAYPGSVRYLHAVRRAGLRTAVVSASANCRKILASAGLNGHFDVVVDGQLARRERLRGKPAPDTYLAAAAALAVRAADAAVFEDALAGVAAGRAGHFGWVVGVDRAGQAEDLLRAGADTVVADLDDLLVSR